MHHNTLQKLGKLTLAHKSLAILMASSFLAERLPAQSKPDAAPTASDFAKAGRLKASERDKLFRRAVIVAKKFESDDPVWLATDHFFALQLYVYQAETGDKTLKSMSSEKRSEIVRNTNKFSKGFETDWSLFKTSNLFDEGDPVRLVLKGADILFETQSALNAFSRLPGIRKQREKFEKQIKKNPKLSGLAKDVEGAFDATKVLVGLLKKVDSLNANAQKKGEEEFIDNSLGVVRGIAHGGNRSLDASLEYISRISRASPELVSSMYKDIHLKQELGAAISPTMSDEELAILASRALVPEIKNALEELASQHEKAVKQLLAKAGKENPEEVIAQHRKSKEEILQDPENFNALTAQQKQYVRQIQIEGLQNAASVTAFVLKNKLRPDQVNDFLTLSHATIGLSGAVLEFRDRLGDSTISKGTKFFSSAIMAGNLLQCGLTIASMFNKPKGPSAEQVIYDELRSFRADFDTFREEVGKHFSRVDVKLNAILDSLDQQLDLLVDGRAQGKEIQVQLEGIALKLNTFFEYFDENARAEEARDFRAIAAPVIDRYRYFSTPIAQKDYEECLRRLLDCALRTSEAPLKGARISGWEDDSLQTLDEGIHSNFGRLMEFALMVQGFPSRELLSELGNLERFVIRSHYYLQAVEAAPEHMAALPNGGLVDIKKRALLYRNVPVGIVGNDLQLFEALFKVYNIRLKELESSVQKLSSLTFPNKGITSLQTLGDLAQVATFKDVTSRPISNNQIMTVFPYGWDDDGAFKAAGVTVPSKELDLLIAPEFKLAEALGLGKIIIYGYHPSRPGKTEDDIIERSIPVMAPLGNAGPARDIQVQVARRVVGYRRFVIKAGFRFNQQLMDSEYSGSKLKGVDEIPIFNWDWRSKIETEFLKHAVNLEGNRIEYPDNFHVTSAQYLQSHWNNGKDWQAEGNIYGFFSDTVAKFSDAKLDAPVESLPGELSIKAESIPGNAELKINVESLRNISGLLNHVVLPRRSAKFNSEIRGALSIRAQQSSGGFKPDAFPGFVDQSRESEASVYEEYVRAKDKLGRAKNAISAFTQLFFGKSFEESDSFRAFFSNKPDPFESAFLSDLDGPVLGELASQTPDKEFSARTLAAQRAFEAIQAAFAENNSKFEGIVELDELIERIEVTEPKLKKVE